MNQPHCTIPADQPRAPRDRLIEAATGLFCRHGINAVGVDTIVAAAGTAKATLYKSFGSKEKLVEAVLEREGRVWRDWFLGALDQGDASPVERLNRIFPLLTEWFRQERFYGCPFINAIGEHDKEDDRLRRLALAHKKVVLERVRQLLEEAGAAAPERMAHQIGILIDGAIVAVMVTRDPAVAAFAEATFASLIGTLDRVAA